MRLLLIEDEHDLARLLKSNLEKAGFAVDVAQDGICLLYTSPSPRDS